MYKKLFLTLVLFIFSTPSWSESVPSYEMIQRDGLWYKKFTNTPFTGTVTGVTQGKILNGKLEGEIIAYHDSGSLSYIGNFKNGIRHGKVELYYENGNLELKGNWKDGKQDGLYETYHENGQLETTELYINGKAEGEFKRYYDNGDLHKEGMCENDNCILKVYDKTGKLTSQETWEGDEKVNEIFY